MADAVATEAPKVIQNEALKMAQPELSANAAAKQKLAELHQKAGARAALEDARKALDPKEKFAQGADDARRKQAVEGNIQGVAPEQQAKRDSLAAALQVVDTYTTRGYDSLAPGSQKLMTEAVLNRMDQVPWLADNISSMDESQEQEFAKTLFKDPQYASNVNRLLQERVNFKITDAMKGKRLKEMQKVDPKATWDQAAGQLEQEWQKSVENIPADAATELMAQQLEHAMSITDTDLAQIDQKAADIAAENKRQVTEAGKQTAKAVMEKFRERWNNKGIFNIDDQRKNDYNAYAQGGLKGVFDYAQVPPEQQEAILNDPDVRAAYEGQFAENFINQRLRTGKLTKEDMYNIADDPALGGDQTARVNKLQSMMESHKQLQDIIKKGQADGTIQRDLWDKMKGLSPLKRKNALLALLSTLVLPVSVGVVLVRHDMGQ